MHDDLAGEPVLRLPYRPPLAWAELLSFLRARAVPGVEAVEGPRYLRALRADGVPATVALEAVPGGHVELRLGASGDVAIAGVAARARRVLDLDSDPHEIAAVLGTDPVLAPLVARSPGLRVPGAWDAFELAVRGILGQQITVRAATTLAGRLVEAFGEPLPAPEGPLTHLFPEPAALAEASVEEIGLPRARAHAIRRLAAAVRDGELDLGSGADATEARRRLQALPGIGPWTAEYVAMRGLNDPDAFPASDLGVRHGLAANGRPATPAEAAARGAAWRPWRAYGVMYLWSRARGTGRGAAA